MVAPSEEGSTRWANGCGASRHMNDRRLDVTSCRTVKHIPTALSPWRITACAMVPLYPNELTPPFLLLLTTPICVGKAADVA